jgi:hypothetical protein
LFHVGKYDTRSISNAHTYIDHSYYLHTSTQYPNSYPNANADSHTNPNSYAQHRDYNTNPNDD